MVFCLFVHPVSVGTWSCPPTTGDKPPPCAWFTFTKVDDSRVVMFGGFTDHSRINDVYILDVKRWVCYHKVHKLTESKNIYIHKPYLA